MTDIAAEIVATMRHPVLVLDHDQSVTVANRAFCKTFQVSMDETLGRRVYELGNGQWEIKELHRLLEEVLSARSEVEDYWVEHEFERIGRRVMLLNARRMGGEGTEARILLAIEDVTERERLRWELEAEKEFAQNTVDASRDALLILGWDLRVKSANETFYTQFRVDPGETEGRLVYELGNGQWDIPRLRELLENVLPDNDAFDDFEVEHEFEEIGRRIMLLNARRIDHKQWILLAIEDVTDRLRAERELRASEARLRKVLETEAVGVLFFDESGTLTGANDVFLRMTGYSRDEVDTGALHWRSMTPPEWVEESEEQMARLVETGRLGPYEKEYFLKDGSKSWMLFAGQRIDEGTIVEFCIDIQDRKRAEEERELLAHELSHRVKNTLAVVQALATQTNGRIRSVEAYRQAFLGRLQALARAHNLLVDAQWHSADLKDLAEQATEAYRVDHPDLIEIEGESVTINAKQGLGLSLVLHELGTNAAKYGALSHHDGRLRVAWEIEQTERGREVRLHWRERGGPPVEPPREKGFGLQMIERAASYELDGEVELDYAPDGLTCRIVFPLEVGA